MAEVELFLGLSTHEQSIPKALRMNESLKMELSKVVSTEIYLCRLFRLPSHSCHLSRNSNLYKKPFFVKDARDRGRARAPRENSARFG